MEVVRNIWQWLSGSHDLRSPYMNMKGEIVMPEYMIKKYTGLINYDRKPIHIGDIIKLPKTIKPRIGRRKISNIARYR